MRLTNRDIKILVDLEFYKYLTTSQVQRLHFSSQKKACRRLKILFDNGYLQRSERSIASVFGKGEYVYCLNREGSAVVSSIMGKKVQIVKPKYRSIRDGQHFEHFLHISDFKINLTIACEHSSELSCYFATSQEVSKVSKQIIPDATFYLENRARKRLLLFLEADRSTESIKASSQIQNDITKKVRAYCRYFDTGGYSAYNKIFNYEKFKGFRLLFVTTGQQRLRNIKHACIEAQANFVWLTTFDRITPETILNDIWEPVSSQKKGLYGFTQLTQKHRGDNYAKT